MTFKRGDKKDRPSGGRPKGSRNSLSQTKRLAIHASGLTPLDYFIQILRDPEQSYERRIDAAKAAAPYIHPRLAAIEHTGAGGKPLVPEENLSLNEVARRIAFILTHPEVCEAAKDDAPSPAEAAANSMAALERLGGNAPH